MTVHKLFFTTLLLVSSLSAERKSDLDRVIVPEVYQDSFYDAILNLAKVADVETILEIGSSSGDGSTDAIAKGIKENPRNIKLFCTELSNARFPLLKKRYANNPNVHCYQVSTVPLEAFPSENEVIQFLRSVKTPLRKFGVKEVLRWLRQDIAYVSKVTVPINGIEFIKKQNGVDTFGMVLIDGSEFTGMAELKAIYGAKYILLDDILVFKNYSNWQQLKKDENYRLIEENTKLRHGYAIFQRLD